MGLVLSDPDAVIECGAIQSVAGRCRGGGTDIGGAAGADGGEIHRGGSDSDLADGDLLLLSGGRWPGVSADARAAIAEEVDEVQASLKIATGSFQAPLAVSSESS